MHENEPTPQEKKMQQLQSAVDRVWQKANERRRLDNIIAAAIVTKELAEVASPQVMEEGTR